MYMLNYIYIYKLLLKLSNMKISVSNRFLLCYMNTQPREMQNRLILRKRSNRRRRRMFLQKTALHTNLKISVKCEAKISI